MIHTCLYISALASESRINREFQKTGSNPGFAVQKFSRLLVKGLKANGITVNTLSNSIIIDNNMYVPSYKEIEDGINYKYIPHINIPILKHLGIVLYTFFYVLCWGFSKRTEKTIICDVLSISVCIGALLASKINRVLSVAVVTDVYGMMIGDESTSLIAKLASFANQWYINSFNKYILLTEEMNSVLNKKKRPYLVMEALCDASLSPNDPTEIVKNQPRTVVYAGGLYEEYGLKMLAEGFLAANVENAKLIYYGSGPYAEHFSELCSKHPNLEYRGVAPNSEVVKEELKASLLVNPRFTTEEYTKYSFPSKNMEFMASGTPLLTTKLPGMPKEYYPYVFLFKEETIQGYADAISNALSYSQDYLNELGTKAKQFVLNNKNNIAQGKRIINFINNLN